jgi:hypothetical protein
MSTVTSQPGSYEAYIEMFCIYLPCRKDSVSGARIE